MECDLVGGGGGGGGNSIGRHLRETGGGDFNNGSRTRVELVIMECGEGYGARIFMKLIIMG